MWSSSVKRVLRAESFRAPAVRVLGVSLVIATALMVWLGYRATREWERSTLSTVEIRGKETLALLAAALERDMKGGQAVLLSLTPPILNAATRYDLADRFLSGFARFPYIESFFVWKAAGDAEGFVDFFSRTDRPPGWDAVYVSDDPYPVMIHRDPVPTQPLVSRTRRRAERGERFTVLESSIGDLKYQTLVHLIYDSSASAKLYGLVGFTVRMEWVRDNYFDDVIRLIQEISGDRDTVIEIVDEDGKIVAQTGPPTPAGLSYAQTFPLLFADRVFMSSLSGPGERPPFLQWTMRVDVSSAGALDSARRGVGRTLALLAVAGIVTIVAVVFTVRAVREAERLADQQSEFVSSMTHEMKTPLALVRLAGDTLAKGRYASETTITEYGRLITTEADKLTQLIDNVLYYARLSDREERHAFERIDVVDLIEESLGRFRPELEELGFDLQLHLPIELPPVVANRAMMGQAIDNLLDNAIKYGGDRRVLIVSASADNDWIHVQVRDRGVGISPDDVPHVFDKFYRGSGTTQRGTGLGLSIVQRVVKKHGGSVDIRSVVDEGTSVHVALPVAERDG